MEVVLVAVEVTAPSSGTRANIGLCFKNRHRLAIAASEGAAGRGNVVRTTVTVALADATSAEDVVERFNELLANLRAAGLLATDNA